MYTHTPCRTQREIVPDKPNQRLKQDQRFSKLVETHLPLPGVTHVKFIQYPVQIYKTRSRKQATLWGACQLTTKGWTVCQKGDDLSHFWAEPNTLRNILLPRLKGKDPSKQRTKKRVTNTLFRYKGQINAVGHYRHLKGSDYTEPVKVRQGGLWVMRTNTSRLLPACQNKQGGGCILWRQ